jgi:SWIM zinc finger
MVLADVFGSGVVKALAGARVYARGVGYVEDGRVVHQTGGARRVRAVVDGSAPYEVELWVDRGEPAWSCTCPAAEDGAFCKHCVAVALTVGEEPGEPGRPRLRVVPCPPPGPDGADGGDSGDGGDDEPGDHLADYVSALPHECLVEMVLDQARTDPRLKLRLLAEVRAAQRRMGG